MRALLLTICVALVGCSGAHGESRPKTASHELPELARSSNEELQAELARLVQEEATPEALARKATERRGARVEIRPRLTTIFTPAELEPLAYRADRLYPRRPFRFDTVDREAMAEYRRECEEKVRQARALLAENPTLSLTPAEGMANEFAFFDAVRTIHHLEAFALAEALAVGEPNAALEPLVRMFHCASILDESRLLTARLEGSELRRQAYRALGAVSNHRAANVSTRSRLRELVAADLAMNLANDDVLRSERAIGLLLYEQIRSGNLLSVLTSEEHARLKREKRLEVTKKAVMRGLDRDQAFYCATMRRLIDGVLAAEQLRDELEAMRETPDFPYVAGNLLLDDLPASLLLLSQDRRLAEAWHVVLSTAIGTPTSAGGEAFTMIHESDNVRIEGVRTVDGVEEIVVSSLR